MKSMKGRFRIVVCGTRFGHAWIDTIANSKRRYQLVAILARGSRHSKDIGLQYRVSIATSVAAVKAKVDAAIVAIGGKAGEDITNEWLMRGIPVLMEHPVSPSFISKAQRKQEVHLPSNQRSFLRSAYRQKIHQDLQKSCRKAQCLFGGSHCNSPHPLSVPRHRRRPIAAARFARVCFRRPELNALGDPEFRLCPIASR